MNMDTKDIVIRNNNVLSIMEIIIPILKKSNINFLQGLL
tara:strand:- start:18 stop:134 length:117 start_codon:yes stop_codon:yes gene_type:complete